MYPARELNELAMRKAQVAQRIGVRRQICKASAQQALRPVLWLDQAREKWEAWSPWIKLVAAPATLLAGRMIKHHHGWIGSILRAAPSLVGLLKVFTR